MSRWWLRKLADNVNLARLQMRPGSCYVENWPFVWPLVTVLGDECVKEVTGRFVNVKNSTGIVITVNSNQSPDGEYDKFTHIPFPYCIATGATLSNKAGQLSQNQ